MSVIVFKLHIHDITFPKMWVVIAKFPSKPRLQQTNCGRRDVKIVQERKISRGNAQMHGISG